MRPTPERAWELIELAYAEHDDSFTVLGWADDGVLYSGPHSTGEPLQFTVYPRVVDSHEDEVILIAIRPPHPDSMTIEEVLGEG